MNNINIILKKYKDSDKVFETTFLLFKLIFKHLFYLR